MNLTRALLIIRNPACYDRKLVIGAACYVLGTLNISQQDALQAASLL